MRTIDGATGLIYDAPDAAPLGDATTPSAPAIASFLGVPVGWVLLAGIALLVLSTFAKRGR